MTIELATLKGNTNVGLYAVPTDQFVIVPSILPDRFSETAGRVLGVEQVLVDVEPSIIGALIIANTHGLVLSPIIPRNVLDELRTALPNHSVERLEVDYFALGNIVLTTDRTTLVSPIVPRATREVIGDTLRTEVVTLRLSNSDLVGSLVRTNGLGAIVSPLVEDEGELENLQTLLDLQEVATSTVNKGSQFPASGILCNKNGALLGEDSTGIETIAISNGLYPT